MSAVQVLVGIALALARGQAAEAVLAGLTETQWTALIVGIGAELLPEVAALFGVKPAYPSLGSLIDAVLKTASDEIARQKIGEWLAANAEWAMKLQPGMGRY